MMKRKLHRCQCHLEAALLLSRGLSGRKGGVVRNITTSHVLDRIAHSFGEPAYEVPVGFKHISQKMDEENLLLGGESSGGLKIRDMSMVKTESWQPFWVEMLAKTGKSLSQLLAEINEKYGTSTRRSQSSLSSPGPTRLDQIPLKEKYIPTLPWKVENELYRWGEVLFSGDTCSRYAFQVPSRSCAWPAKPTPERMQLN